MGTYSYIYNTHTTVYYSNRRTAGTPDGGRADTPVGGGQADTPVGGGQADTPAGAMVLMGTWAYMLTLWGEREI